MDANVMERRAANPDPLRTGRSIYQILFPTQPRGAHRQRTRVRFISPIFIAFNIVQVFGRGGMHSLTGDTPQRKGLHGLKGANDKTKLPCSLCWAKQSQEEEDVGGELGERNFDIVKHRRTRGQVEEGRRRLREAGLGTPAAQRLSMELGIVQPDGLNEPRILFDLCSIHNPMLSCGPELLHLDCLVRVRHPGVHM